MAFIDTVAEITQLSPSMIYISSVLSVSSVVAIKHLLSNVAAIIMYQIIFPAYTSHNQNIAKSQAKISSIKSEISSGNFTTKLQSYASLDSPFK